ncbi:deaminase domain-containing protein [Thermogemmatispora sp.]|uniref:deaminase domain-containing protein n=1 Tax=Thermogemmatispora sp. TaxID=1968838 RepID=UPI0035E3F8E3
MHQQAADQLRASARDADRIVAPFLSLVNHIMDQLTPDLVVREGEAPIHAVCADLRHTLNSLDHSTGKLLHDVFSLNLSGLAHDAEEEGKELSRLVGDALAGLAVVEPALAQWAAETAQVMDWLSNQGARLLNNVADHVLNIEDLFTAAAILYDPNALPRERLGAVFLIACTLYQDLTLFCPEADILNFAMHGVFEAIGKTVLKDLLEEGGKLLLEGSAKGLRKFLALFSRSAEEEGAQRAEQEGLHAAEEGASHGLTGGDPIPQGDRPGENFVVDSQGRSYSVPSNYRPRFGNQVSADFERAQEFRQEIIDSFISQIPSNISKEERDELIRGIERDWSWRNHNVCFVRYKLEDGTTGEILAISGVESPRGALAVANNERKFLPTAFQFTDSGRVNLPLSDSEDKALHALASELDRLQEQGSGPKVVQVYLYSEREPCPSCLGIIQQFEQRYGIKVDVNFDFEYIGPPRQVLSNAVP